MTLLASCTVARNVRPVGRGRGAVGIGVGGPIFKNLGAPIPVPVAVAFGRYGLTDRTDIDIGLHLPVVRATGLDVGIGHLLLDQHGAIPALLAGARLTLLGNGRSLLLANNPATQRPFALAAHLFEEVYATASWRLHPAWVVYGGIDAFMQLEAGNVRPSGYAGAMWHAAGAWIFSLEAKAFAFTSPSANLAVDYVGLRGRGALGVQLGAMYTFDVGSGT